MARRGRRALRNCTAIHLLAPYGVAVVPLLLTRQMGGSRKVSLTLTRAARPEGKGMIRKRGETIGVSPLVRLPRAAALSARDARAHRARRGRGSELGAPRSWPRPASLAAARQFTFSRPTIPVCNGIVFSGRAMRAPTRCKRQTARQAAKSPAYDARAPSLPYLANILTAQGHYLRSIFTPFFAAAINASTSSLVLNGANDTRMALSVRALGRPSARSTPLCLPLEHADPLDT